MIQYLLSNTQIICIIYKNIEEYNPNKKTKSVNCFWLYDYWYA